MDKRASTLRSLERFLKRRPFEERMIEAHEREMHRRKAEPYNFGWAMTDLGIASKTSKGILDTEWNKKKKKFIHSWTA